MVSTHLKNSNQIGSYPQGSGLKFKKMFEITTQRIHGMTVMTPGKGVMKMSVSLRGISFAFVDEKKPTRLPETNSQSPWK